MKLRTMLLALAVASAGLLATSAAAQAAPSPEYPTATCPTLSVSTTTPLPGASVAVTGKKFNPNAHVRLELHTTVYVLANVVTSAQGTFQTTVKLPAGVTGSHLIVAVGGGAHSQDGCPANPVQIVSINGGGSGNPPGGTAFTGVDVLLLVLVAAALLGAGLALNQSGKRRRRVSSSRL